MFRVETDLVDRAATAAARMDQVQILPYFLRIESRLSARGAGSGIGNIGCHSR
jgi:hypothetical protein